MKRWRVHQETTTASAHGSDYVARAAIWSARLSLAPEACSVSAARRWVGAQVIGRNAEVAELLVSELVTNAVLHTGTPVEVALDCTPTGIRVEVADSSTVLPSPKHYAADANTGRGLVLLEALASSWGIMASPTGKVVWFTLADTDAGADVLDPSPVAVVQRLVPTPSPRQHEGLGPDRVRIQLLQVPVPMLRRASEQYDGLFREFRLVVDHDSEQSTATPGRLLELADELALRFSGFTGSSDAQLQAAIAADVKTIDLDYCVPAEAGAASGLYDRLLDEADAYCRAGVELLTVAPSAEAVGVRKWVLGEFTQQAAGGQPVPWPESTWAQGSLLDQHHPGRDDA